MYKKNSIKLQKRLFVLHELEKFEETEMSIFGSRFQNVEELKEYRSKKSERIKFLTDPTIRALSRIKIVNKGLDAYDRDSRRHPSYKTIFDRKYVKLLNERSYRRENLYESFRTM